MHSRSIFRSTSIISILILNHCALISAWPLHTRQSATCTDPNAAFDQSCWENLNLGDFLTNPKTGWNATLGQPCVKGDNAAYCCRSTEASWSACFMRQAVNLAHTFSCASINASNCPTSSLTITPEVASAAQPKVRYVLHNIYCKTVHLSHSLKRCTNSRAERINLPCSNLQPLQHLAQRAPPRNLRRTHQYPRPNHRSRPPRNHQPPGPRRRRSIPPRPPLPRHLQRHNASLPTNLRLNQRDSPSTPPRLAARPRCCERDFCK